MTALVDYTNLITSEHSDKPKFVASLSTIAQALVSTNNALASIPALFDVDTAVGQQLDYVGQWIGFSRTLNAPLPGVYFALDTAGVGFDEGVWKGPFDPSEGLISLDDETYRVMLKLKIASNNWDGSLAGAQVILNSAFLSISTFKIFLQDNFDMSMIVGVVGPGITALIMAMFGNGYFSMKPAAVAVSNTIFSPGPIFGFDTTNDFFAGFDAGLWV